MIIALLSVLIVTGSAVVYKKLPNNIAEYDKKMEEFSAIEQEALKVYTMLENSPTEELIKELKESGIPKWKKINHLVDELTQLDLPDILKERNLKLKEYCKLRLQIYDLMYKALEEDTHFYDKELENYNRQIEKILDELSGK